MFSANEFQKRYFILSVSEGTFRFTMDYDAAMNPKAGKLFMFSDINEIKADYADGGKAIDFSGDKNYPFPFCVKMHQRELILAAKTKEDRILWVNAFMVLYEAKLIRTQIDGEAFVSQAQFDAKKRSKS